MFVVAVVCVLRQSYIAQAGLQLCVDKDDSEPLISAFTSQVLGAPS